MAGHVLSQRVARLMRRCETERAAMTITIELAWEIGAAFIVCVLDWCGSRVVSNS